MNNRRILKISNENRFPFRQDDIQELVVRLMGRRVNFTNPIGDADGEHVLHGAQPFETPVVVACSISDAVSAPVKAGERNEKEIRLDQRRGCERLGDAHPSDADGVPWPP